MTSSLTLLAEIERFSSAHGIAPTTFGLRAVRDGKLVTRLREGKSVTLATAEKIRAYMAANPAPVAEAREPEVAA